jgi:hypothetical protein
LCYNSGLDALHLRGTFWYQETRREKVVSGLEERVVQALRQFHAKTGRLPKHLVFYRDGVSEGQYLMVGVSLVPALRSKFLVPARIQTFSGSRVNFFRVAVFSQRSISMKRIFAFYRPLPNLEKFYFG